MDENLYFSIYILDECLEVGCMGTKSIDCMVHLATTRKSSQHTCFSYYSFDYTLPIFSKDVGVGYSFWVHATVAACSNIFFIVVFHDVDCEQESSTSLKCVLVRVENPPSHYKISIHPCHFAPINHEKSDVYNTFLLRYASIYKCLITMHCQCTINPLNSLNLKSNYPNPSCPPFHPL